MTGLTESHVQTMLCCVARRISLQREGGLFVKLWRNLAWSHCGPLTGRVTPAWQDQTQVVWSLWQQAVQACGVLMPDRTCSKWTHLFKYVWTHLNIIHWTWQIPDTRPCLMWEFKKKINLSRGGVWCWHKASDLLSFSAHLLDSTMTMKTMKTHMDCLGLAASQKQCINEKKWLQSWDVIWCNVV